MSGGSRKSSARINDFSARGVIPAHNNIPSFSCGDSDKFIRCSISGLEPSFTEPAQHESERFCEL